MQRLELAGVGTVEVGVGEGVGEAGLVHLHDGRGACCSATQVGESENVSPPPSTLDAGSTLHDVSSPPPLHTSNRLHPPCSVGRRDHALHGDDVHGD